MLQRLLLVLLLTWAQRASVEAGLGPGGGADKGSRGTKLEKKDLICKPDMAEDHPALEDAVVRSLTVVHRCYQSCTLHTKRHTSGNQTHCTLRLLLLLLLQVSCRPAPVTCSRASRTPPCGGSSSSSSGGCANTRRAAAPCPSSCTTSGGRGCRRPTGCATR